MLEPFQEPKDYWLKDNGRWTQVVAWYDEQGKRHVSTKHPLVKPDWDSLTPIPEAPKDGFYWWWNADSYENDGTPKQLWEPVEIMHGMVYIIGDEGRTSWENYGPDAKFIPMTLPPEPAS